MENDLKKILGNARVLIADDEIFILRIISRLIHEMGCSDVNIAKSGADCLAMLNQHTTLLILDFNMPNINGLHILKEIRSGNTKAPHTMTVLMLTSSNDFNLVGAAMSLDVDGFILKPISHTTLAKHLIKVYNAPKDYKEIFEYNQINVQKIANQLLMTTVPPTSKSEIQRVVVLPLDKLYDGLVLADDIFAGKELILSKDTELTARLIKRLHEISDVLKIKEVVVYYD